MRQKIFGSCVLGPPPRHTWTYGENYGTADERWQRAWARYRQELNLKATRAMLEDAGPPPSPEQVAASVGQLAWYRSLGPSLQGLEHCFPPLDLDQLLGPDGDDFHAHLRRTA